MAEDAGIWYVLTSMAQRMYDFKDYLHQSDKCTVLWDLCLGYLNYVCIIHQPRRGVTGARESGVELLGTQKRETKADVPVALWPAAGGCSV